MRKIVISDIHGCARTFRTLVEEQLGLTAGDELFLLGDYVNRGPDPLGVVEFIWELQVAGVEVTCLRGNHEDRFLWALDAGRLELPRRYVHFFRNLKLYHEVDGYFLVHAGLNFRFKDPLQDTYSMRWIRKWEEEVDIDWLAGRTLVHGHIRKMNAQIREAASSGGPVIGIDNGCFAVHTEGQGALCALDLRTREVFFQPNVDRMPIRDSYQRNKISLRMSLP